MIRIHRSWLFVLAMLCALAVGPPSRAQQPEASIGRDVPPIVGMSGESFVITVLPRSTFDFHGLRFYEVATAPLGRITITADGDLPLAHTLDKFAGKKLRLTLEPIELQQFERDDR